MDELRACPFCGSTKLKVEYKSRYAGSDGLGHRVELHTYSVRCNACHARGGSCGGRIARDPRAQPNWATTATALKARAIEAWNRRAGEENPEPETEEKDQWVCPKMGVHHC